MTIDHDHCVDVSVARLLLDGGGAVLEALDTAEKRITALERERDAVLAAVHKEHFPGVLPIERCHYSECKRASRALADHRAAGGGGE